MKVLLLAGGASNEREVSQRSGDNVEQALHQLGHMVVRADPAAEGFNLAQLVVGVEVVFPALHGAGGEDGVLQEELERLGIPFVGSGAAAAKLTFNKADCKQVLRQHHILTPESEVVSRSGFEQSELPRSPFVLKPVDGGSSIDTFIVRDPAERPDIEVAFSRHRDMLLERLVAGDEVTVSVVGEAALPVILIVPPSGEEFDYVNKYNGKSQEIVAPSQLPAELQQRAQALAVQVHNLTGCRQLSRTDIIIDAEDKLYVLEINTLPGMTAQSLLPQAAAAAGMSMADLVQRLLDLAK